MSLETEHHPKWSAVKNKSEKTLWVNGRSNCLGRFSPVGYEVYRKLEDSSEVEAGPTDTLSVKVTNLNDKDWSNFITLMKENHNIDLSEEENPLHYVVLASDKEEEE